MHETSPTHGSEVGNHENSPGQGATEVGVHESEEVDIHESSPAQYSEGYDSSQELGKPLLFVGSTWLGNSKLTCEILNRF